MNTLQEGKYLGFMYRFYHPKYDLDIMQCEVLTVVNGKIYSDYSDTRNIIIGGYTENKRELALALFEAIEALNLQLNDLPDAPSPFERLQELQEGSSPSGDAEGSRLP